MRYFACPFSKLKMEINPTDIITAKFKELRSKEDDIFESENLKIAFDKEEKFKKSFDPFYLSLENTIKSLPKNTLSLTYIDRWVENLDGRIEKARKKRGELAEIGKLFLRYRKKLKVKLLEINSILLDNEINVKELPNDPQDVTKSFGDIFIPKDWKIYVDALSVANNPVLSNDYEFIGKTQKHKGVICSWVKELQIRGIINKKFTRQQLAIVLNNEIKNLHLGKDGKTFDNFSKVYDDEYKATLLKRTNLLP